MPVTPLHLGPGVAFIPIVILMFRKKDGGISVVAKKALRNRNVFLTTTINLWRPGVSFTIGLKDEPMKHKKLTVFIVSCSASMRQIKPREH